MRAVSLVLLAAFAAGCGEDAITFNTPARMSRGLVIILPGIEGESWMNHGIRSGLDEGGVQSALPIYHWGRPVPIAGPLINQMDFLGNRLQGSRIAQMIVQYQDAHPGQPVLLVGHSGGGGVAVFAAEALPPGRQVDGLVLLSASISSGYDLSKALGKTRRGIVNFHNPNDKALLLIGTTLAGNVDGSRGPSAGLGGFERPSSAAPDAYAKVYQIMLTDGIASATADPHAAATEPRFVSRHVAPWVLSAVWPASPLARSGGSK
jgi:pimeloyl-ACP methyl ester carboxylesterase